ncbi:MAG TPA: AarF/UbiB family protein [Acidimicrobiales bacterium]|nr:AarF/UbiB family protein [Acidimicrobiales bacterium]
MSLKPRYLAQYKDIGALLIKHGRSGLNHRSDPAATDGSAAADHDAEELAADLEAKGPTFVKLGQVLSTRADLLPTPYLKALSRLQDKVEPFSFDEVEQIVAVELGVKVSKAFASFEPTPIASASLGQVHRGELRDGRPVAVKVQRPNIRARIVDDMDAIESIAEFADEHTDAGRRFGFVDMVAEFRRSLMAELDYRQEARNLVTLGSNLAHHARIVVPQPVEDYTTGVVLTMDYLAGRNVGRLGPLALMELDGPRMARELFSAYLDQILVDGFFHADPHPGNILVTDDGKLGLLDLGMVARVAPEMQDSLIKLLLAVSQGHGLDAAEISIEIGQKLDDYDVDRFRREAAELVSRNQGSTIDEIQAGAVVGELTRISGGCGLRLPAELTMLGKALLNLDEVVRVLDPDFDPNAAIEREGTDLMRRKLTQAVSPGNVMAAAMEAKEFAERFPGRVNKVMDALAEGELKLRVQGIDEQDIMRSVQKLANRVTSGVVIASLIIGAALIMRVPTTARLFGYPTVAIVLFLLAAAAGAWLLVSIQLRDLPQRKRRRP